MKFDPISRLNRFIEELKDRGHCSPAEAVDVLRRCRLILEGGKLKKTYPTLSLYCDWIMHTELDRNPTGHELIRRLDAVIVNILQPSSEVLMAEVSKELNIGMLRTEIITLFKSNNIDPIIFKDNRSFKKFLMVLLDELSDRPIMYPNDVRTNTKAKGYESFQKSIKYRKEKNIRIDTTITEVSFNKKFEENGDDFTYHWELACIWKNEGAEIRILGPLLYHEQD